MKKSVIPDRSSAENPMPERILGAAFKAFTEDGYAGTSTLEIARRAKVSKRDLYANFGGKHAVLVACIVSRAERLRLPPALPTPRSRQLSTSPAVVPRAVPLPNYWRMPNHRGSSVRESQSRWRHNT